MIPPRMHAALQRYVQKGIRPGHFLTALLANDFMGAYQYADDENIQLLPEYARIIYNDIPNACHGSYEIVERWVRGHTNE